MMSSQCLILAHYFYFINFSQGALNFETSCRCFEYPMKYNRPLCNLRFENLRLRRNNVVYSLWLLDFLWELPSQWNFTKFQIYDSTAKQFWMFVHCNVSCCTQHNMYYETIVSKDPQVMRFYIKKSTNKNNNDKKNIYNAIYTVLFLPRNELK